MSPVPMDSPTPEQVPVRDAATVMLLRDGSDGPEVCLMQRNLNSDFVGGAYVFPGGAVDPADAEVAVAQRCPDLDDVEASRRLGLAVGGLAFWVAAIRESFEEAGVLLARHADGRRLDLSDPGAAERFAGHRDDVDNERRTIAEVAVQEDLHLDVGQLHYFSRWITPLGAHRRYDTRFFVCAAPEGQEVVEDSRELIGTQWLTPAEALRRHDAGDITMIFPTVRTLVALSRFDRADAVLDHARAQSRVEGILPTISDGDDGMRIVLPGDPEHVGGVYDAWTARPLSPDHD
ncbi:MAG TPA: NUDIX domain-containing protein [Microthrixaceae bacterium]|nr:NUDIX domain-containing protein [Microthrixaceae bacterium]MCO5305429.1 NUDIX domain-containing protein [Microthrixaceae bacterium]HMU79791.1 NUDIX domain-containing protein [Microthrixaceae bacterium]HMV74042.1 NUDIX domain-containing protein [Microthrixaceae bacterium]HMX06563.1 NUDIX domain-containing protein [Microthrixaceae bacterium]